MKFTWQEQPGANYIISKFEFTTLYPLSLNNTYRVTKQDGVNML